MNTRQLSRIDRKLTRRNGWAALIITLAFLAAGLEAKAGGRDSDDHPYQGKRQASGRHEKSDSVIDKIVRTNRGILNALIQHHRKERLFILSLISGEKLRYESESGRVRAYERKKEAQNRRRYRDEDWDYSEPAAEPTPRRTSHQYPDYSGY